MKKKKVTKSFDTTIFRKHVHHAKFVIHKHRLHFLDFNLNTSFSGRWL